MCNHAIVAQCIRPYLAALLLVCAGTACTSALAAAHSQIAHQQGSHAIGVGHTMLPMHLRSMHLLNVGTGWVTSADALLWTQDGGDHWDDMTPPELAPGGLQRALLLDSQHAWVVGLAATDADRTSAVRAVFATADGGFHWASHALPESLDPAAQVVSLTFADEQHGWIMLRLPSSANFSHGLLLHSDDGGKHWRRLPTPPSSGAITLLASGRGWLVGGVTHDHLYVTSDGGESWEPQSLPLPVATPASTITRVFAPHFREADDGTLAVVVHTHAGTVLHSYASHDGGASWADGVTMTLGPDADQVVSSAVDAGTLVATAANKRLTIIAQGQQRTSALPAAHALAPDEAVTALDFTDAQHGWMLISGGSCARDKTDCQQHTRLITTDDGGGDVFDATPQVLAPQNAPDGATPAEVVWSTTNGFDQCAAGTYAQMQDWFTSTPWSWANVYIGGANRGCSQSHLNASWVSHVLAQGWLLVPTWVGRQAPSSSCGSCSKISTNTSTAATQGTQEADAAANALANLGLSWPSIVYYDMEQYSTSSAAVRAFINAWVVELHHRGSQAGVYGGGSNASHDWAPIANPPDAVWIANWNGHKSVFGLTGLSDSLWAHHERIHQYNGPHNETWGDVTFNIDSNYSDSPVAGVCTVGGAILTEYNHMGGASGILGPCTTSELPTADGVGRYNHFVNGSIYWSPSTNAHEIHGAIHTLWVSTGWESGPLGYPLTDETATSDSNGRFNHFQHGSIYWTSATHAHFVTGAIFNLWYSMGAEASCLGYPTSDPYTSGGLQRSDFQHGHITYSSTNGAHSSCPAIPTVAAKSVSTDYHTAVHIDLSSSITGDDITAVAIHTGASHGTTSVSGKTVTYTPSPAYNGGNDSFTYTATNPGGTSASAKVSITIGANDVIFANGFESAR